MHNSAFLAHAHPSDPTGPGHGLEDNLQAVAALAARFAPPGSAGLGELFRTRSPDAKGHSGTYMQHIGFSSPTATRTRQGVQ